MRGIETSVKLNWSFQHALTVKMRFYARPLMSLKRLFHTSFGFIDFFYLSFIPDFLLHLFTKLIICISASEDENRHVSFAQPIS